MFGLPDALIIFCVLWLSLGLGGILIALLLKFLDWMVEDDPTP